MVFTLAASASAALLGFFAGLPGLALPWRPAPGAAAALALAVVTLDLAAMRPAAPQPPSVRKQVPVEWSRLFAPAVVALLYGARLGVGPLTILRTWLWWGAFLLGALLGPLHGMAVGASFALARVISTLGLGMWVRQHAPRRMAHVRAVERRSAYALLGLAAALTVAVSTP